MTAAHVIADGNTGVLYTNIKVYPAYNIPVPTPGLSLADYWYDAAFFQYPNAPDRSAHDLAFIRLAADHPLPAYLALYPINSAVDIGTDEQGAATCYAGNPLTDPWAIQGYLQGHADSWFNGANGQHCGLFGVPHYQTSTFTAGYPESVNGVPNDIVLPYEDRDSRVTGSHLFDHINQAGLRDYIAYSLYHPDNTSLPSIATFATITPGDSGGPILGYDYFNNGAFPNWALLGVIGSEVTNYFDNLEIGGLGAGNFPYNTNSISTNLAWSPASLVVISSPTEGTTYQRQSVPNFQGTAGQITAQLQWSSNVDGVLGTGGSIAVANRLTAGAQTITAKIPGSSLATKTVHITIAVPAPSFTLTPTTVPVGTYAGTGAFAVAYSAPAYTSLDWTRAVNGGTYQVFMTTPNSGTYNGSIAANVSYSYKIYPHLSTTQLLTTLNVTGVVAAAPSMSASPTTVSISGPQTSGPYTIQWSAPGYPDVDLRGRVNGGTWNPSVWVGATSNYGDTIPVSTTYDYQILPHGDTTHVLASATIRGVTTGTFTVTPAHVVVPAGQTSGTYRLDWNAPGYPSLDLWGKINSGGWNTPVNISASGNYTDAIPLGSTYTYRFYPHGDSTHVLKELTFSASH